MIVKYAIRRRVAPVGSRSLRVDLKRIKVHENRDWLDAGIYIWYRVFDGITERSGKFGPRDMGDGDTWNINRTIFRTLPAGPILHVEIDVWDEDSPGWGDDHDLLGTTAITWHRERGIFRRTIKQRRAYVTIEYEISGW